MEFFKPGLHIDFMRHRRIWAGISITLVALSLLSFIWPGPNYGTDFSGGTEIHVGFRGAVTSAELREALEALEYEGADVVAVVGRENEYILRIREFSSIESGQRDRIQQAVREAAQSNGNLTVNRIRIPEGGDRVRVELSGELDPQVLQTAVESTGARVLRAVQIGDGQNVYEVQLVGVAEELISGLQDRLGDRGPNTPERIERVGPRAGAQLRDAALKSVLYAIALIMVYVAFRFDLRFAPGGVIALAHDAIIMVGAFVFLRKEFNLTIIAAVLTIIGYSINDTIVTYDRIRENLGKYRDKSLYDVINLSTSQTLSRTIMTSGMTLLSISAFFIWGTTVIRDLCLALFIGMIVGVYSSVYIAAPLTEWMDRKFFARSKAEAGRARARQRSEA